MSDSCPNVSGFVIDETLGDGYFWLLIPAFSCATPEKGVAQLTGKSHVKAELFMHYHILSEKKLCDNVIMKRL